MTRIEELEAARDKAKQELLDAISTADEARTAVKDRQDDLAAAEALLSIGRRKSGRADS